MSYVDVPEEFRKEFDFDWARYISPLCLELRALRESL